MWLKSYKSGSLFTCAGSAVSPETLESVTGETDSHEVTKYTSADKVPVEDSLGILDPGTEDFERNFTKLCVTEIFQRGLLTTKFELHEVPLSEGETEHLKQSSWTELSQGVAGASSTAETPVKPPSILREHYHVKVNFKNGNSMSGDIVDYSMDGKVLFHWADGTFYEGEFRNDQMNGDGKLTWPDLSYYKGQFKANKRHGIGHMVASNGKSHYGHWYKGMKEGEGQTFYTKNSWYDGEWHRGLPHGIGLRQYESGARYYGQWLNGKKDGAGVMVWSNNDMYMGEWSKGKMDGMGRYSWNTFLNQGLCLPLGNSYFGSWTDGEMDGEGVLQMASGAQIKGQWVKGRKAGRGGIICNNGSIVKGKTLFVNNEVIRRKRRSRRPSATLESVPNSSRRFVPVVVPVNAPYYEMDLSNYIHYKLTRDYDLEGSLYPVMEEAEAEKLNQEITTCGCQTSPLDCGLPPVKRQSATSDLVWRTTSISDQPDQPNSAINVTQDYLSTDGSSDFDYVEDEVKLEKKWLKNVLINRSPKLRQLYYKYATVFLDKKPDYNPGMIRLNLWLLLCDAGLEEMNLTLAEMDKRMGRTTNPFEVITMSDMVEYLLEMSDQLCFKKGLWHREIPARLAGAFDYFVTDRLVPCLTKEPDLFFLQLDLLPLDAVFALYQNYAPSYQLSELLNDVCPEDFHFVPLARRENFFYTFFLRGRNVLAPDGTVFYLNEHEEVTVPFELKTLLERTKFEKPPRNILLLLGVIGQNKVFEVVRTTFPGLKDPQEGTLMSSKHEFTFLEFCYFLMECIMLYRDKEKVWAPKKPCKFPRDFDQTEKYPLRVSRLRK